MEATESFGAEEGATAREKFPDKSMSQVSEESSESEEEEEEDEPKLKYKRLANDLIDILSKDAASCIAVHPKFMALGTHWGMIHILDHVGNRIDHSVLAAHSTTVNQITIDDGGEYLASCSDDGKVVINGLCTKDHNQVLNFDRPVKAVAMDPNFSKGSAKSFVTGDDQLILNGKGFLGRNKVVLNRGEGPIRCIKWNGDYIAWANDKSVIVYDMDSRKVISNIEKNNPKIRAAIYRCSLCWRNKYTLLIAWANEVKICIVKDHVTRDARNLPNKFIEIVSMFKTNFYTCGIAALDNYLVVLTYDESEVYQEAGHRVCPRPHLQIIEPHQQSYEVINNDALTIRGFEEYRCNDYHMECIIEENMYLIVSPKDVVVVTPRDQDDHITWLMDNKKYEEAMKAATEHSKVLKKHSVQTIGRQYLAFLTSKGHFQHAARLCMKVLGQNKKLWEEEVYKFAGMGQLRVIVEYIPLADPRLSPGIYEMLLNEFLQTYEEGFEMLIRDWPHDIYHIQTLVNAVVDKIERYGENDTLYRCLAELYTHDKRHDKALGIYLKLKHEKAFDLIHKYNLFNSISDKIVLLMEYDKEKAVKLFLENMNKVPIDKVVTELAPYPALQHAYLHQLFIRDQKAGHKYHTTQIKLYAEFDRSQLINFLSQSNYYPLHEALEHMRLRGYHKEMVFLLGRMGNGKDALKLIINEIDDIDQAIEFCKEYNDKELWEDLIDHAINKPTFVSTLLDNVGTHIDPIMLIGKIKNGMEIPKLRDSLVKILQDYNLQIALREGCKKILVSDCFTLLEKLVKTQKKVHAVEDNQVCHTCNEEIIVRDLRFASDMIIFYCGHTFHEDCLPAHNMSSCPICSIQKKIPFSSSTG